MFVFLGLFTSLAIIFLLLQFINLPAIFMILLFLTAEYFIVPMYHIFFFHSLGGGTPRFFQFPVIINKIRHEIKHWEDFTLTWLILCVDIVKYQ